MQPVPPPATACGRDARRSQRGALAAADAAAAAGLAPRLLPGRDGPGHRPELRGRAAAALSGHGACSRAPAPGAPPPPAASARWVRARAGGRRCRVGWGARPQAPGTLAPARAECTQPRNPLPRGWGGGSRSPGTPSCPGGGVWGCSPGPSREAPGSRWLPFGSRPGTGGSVRSQGSQGAPFISLLRAPPPSVCREVLSLGGGEGG